MAKKKSSRLSAARRDTTRGTKKKKSSTRNKARETSHHAPLKTAGDQTRRARGKRQESGDARDATPHRAATAGMRLGVKFALMVATLIASVGIAWSLAISNLTEKALTKEIIRNSANTIMAASMYGGARLQDRIKSDERGALENQKGILELIFKKNGETTGITLRQIELALRFPERLSKRDGYEFNKGYVNNTPAMQIVTDILTPEGGEFGKAIIYVSLSHIAAVRGDLIKQIVGMGLVFLALGIAISIVVGNKIARPAEILVTDMQRVAEGDYSSGTRANSNDEFGVIAKEFNYMTDSLARLHERNKDHERIEVELDAAREIQAGLLPKKVPQIPGFDVYPFYRSAKEVGGDYYDFFPLDRENLATVVADVSGKGIPGSMVMALTRTALRIFAPQCIAPDETLKRTNEVVAKDIARGMFVTAIYASINVRTKQMLVCSAGHNPMAVFRERTGEVEQVNPGGIALGFDAGPVFTRALQIQTVQLELGDRVVLYTDGVVEAMSEEQEEYGDDRFFDFVKKYARMRSKDFVEKLVVDLDDHKGDGEQHDDITITTFRLIS